MKTSNKGIELIKKHEGCKLTAYKCPAGIWTIGYGHTGSDVFEGLSISADVAIDMLRKDLQIAELAIERERLVINQNQFDSLVSFVFNVGVGNFKNSTLLKRIKENPKHPDITYQFGRWNKSNGNVIPGLVKRREDEAKLYLTT